jgi:hypothetical protein
VFARMRAKDAARPLGSIQIGLQNHVPFGIRQIRA